MKTSTKAIEKERHLLLYKKSGKPTSEMKKGLLKSLSLFDEPEMKTFDFDHYKEKAWRT